MSHPTNRRRRVWTPVAVAALAVALAIGLVGPFLSTCCSPGGVACAAGFTGMIPSGGGHDCDCEGPGVCESGGPIVEDCDCEGGCCSGVSWIPPTVTASSRDVSLSAMNAIAPVDTRPIRNDSPLLEPGRALAIPSGRPRLGFLRTTILLI